MLFRASGAEAVFTLNGVAVTDLPTREVVEGYTLARNLQTVRFRETTRIAEGLYREMQTWSDVRPEDLDAYRQAFLAKRGSR